MTTIVRSNITGGAGTFTLFHLITAITYHPLGPWYAINIGAVENVVEY